MGLMTSTLTHLCFTRFTIHHRHPKVTKPPRQPSRRHATIMNEDAESSKRRHILYSFNPEVTDQPEQPEPKRRRASPPGDDDGRKDRRSERSRERDEQERRAERRRRRDERAARADGDVDHNTRPRTTRLKLKNEHKSHRRRRRRSRSRSHNRDDPESEKSTSHRKHQERTREPTPPNPYDLDPFDQDMAFTEAVIDSMASQEGAEHWEAAFGQPLHIYDEVPKGKLESMTDNEYAAYVRQKMWEKTNEGYLEEKARQDEQRKKRKEEDKRKRRLEREVEEEDRRRRKMEREVEDSLRRGEERRANIKAKETWRAYEQGWKDWDGKPDNIFWPDVPSKTKEVDPDTVRVFFIKGLQLKDVGERIFIARLKDERVRWHPDKIQQKAGGTVDAATMRQVTAVFQIIDRLWGEMRAKA